MRKGEILTGLALTAGAFIGNADPVQASEAQEVPVEVAFTPLAEEAGKIVLDQSLEPALNQQTRQDIDSQLIELEVSHSGLVANSESDDDFWIYFLPIWIVIIAGAGGSGGNRRN